MTAAFGKPSGNVGVPRKPPGQENSFKTLVRSEAMERVSPEPESESANDDLLLPAWGDLVVRIQQGDPLAMEELYAFFSKGVRYFFLRALGPEELEDRVHDCFVVVTQAIRQGELRDPDRLMGYVRTVVKRQIAGVIEQSVSRRKHEVDFADNLFSIADWKQDPEESVVSQERETIGRRVLKEISERDREVLLRFYVHEQPYETICEEMNLTYNQFRLLKSRAKARFGKLGRRLADLAGANRKKS